VGRPFLAAVVLGVLFASACGIKGPPKPPLEATAVEAPREPCDAGCGEKK